MAKRETASEIRERMRRAASHTHPVNVVTDNEPSPPRGVEPTQEERASASMTEPTPQHRNATTLQRRGYKVRDWAGDYADLEVYPYTVHLPQEDLEWIKDERNKRHFRREWMVVKLAIDRLRAEVRGGKHGNKETT